LGRDALLFVWLSSLGFASGGILRSRLRCSEGGFGLWLGDEGIVMVKRAHNLLYSNTYNPQQNGVSKRKNRAIIGAARSMLHDQSLPLYLWAEACATTIYLQNRSPHRILGKMTPEEAFTSRRPDVEHIRIFGCSTFSHVPSERRTKLDPTAQQGILVGYSEVSKAYRIYIPPLRKVQVSRDVRFEEDKDFARSLESSRGVEDDAELPVAVSEGA
jgi:hypothetical protein